MKSRILKMAPAVVLPALLLFAACGSPPGDILTRMRNFSKIPAAQKATVTLDLPLFAGSRLQGVYECPSPDTVRYILSNESFRIDLSQSGREVWMSMAGGGVHLTPEDVTETEYARLRGLIGPFGVPLLSMPDFVRFVEREYVVAQTRREGWAGDDRVVLSPRPAFRDALISWINVMVGEGHPLNEIVPDTVLLRVSREDGHIVELKQLSSNGRPVATLAFDFANAPSTAPAPFSPPEEPRLFLGTRELVLALGAGPDWLIGKSVPDGRLRRMDGRLFAISDFRGRPLFVTFWATWCKPCQIEWPVLQELYRKHGKEATFLFLTNEAEPTVRGYLEASGYPASPVYMAADHRIYSGFGVNGYPATYVVDSSGIIRHVFVGLNPQPSIAGIHAELREKYETVLAGVLTGP